MPDFLRLAFAGIFILPSLAAGAYLIDHHVPVQYGYFVACTVTLLAVFDFATIVFIDQYYRHLGSFTLPALLGAIAIIFLFVTVESINRFVEGLGYAFLTPFIAVAVLMLYAAIITEKSMMLKFYLSINSIALALLWAMGASDKIIMPF